MNNIPQVKLGIVAVSRDCFPIGLSQSRRAAVVAACAQKGLEVYEAQTTVENEKDMLAAVEEVTKAGCNALTVFLGNFGPETPETLIAKHFDGPCMFVAAAEGDGDLINGRGDAYCGMLNCSYNLGLRGIKGYIPEYPVGTAEEIAEKMVEFVPIARAVLGLKGLKIITFGPRPQDFFACNAPIQGLYDLGVEIEENSELDLLLDEGDVDAILMGKKTQYPDAAIRLTEQMAQEFINDLFSTLRERMLDLQYCKVVFVGGGAILLKRQIETSGKVGAPFFVSKINANADGYEYLYRIETAGR